MMQHRSCRLVSSLVLTFLLVQFSLLEAVQQPKKTLFEQVADDLANDVTLVKEKTNTTLPHFNSIGAVYPIGVSSGASLAHQLHVAYSTFFSGAGIIAGSPWWCASGTVDRALFACMDDSQPLGLGDLIAAAKVSSSQGEIDSTANLANSPVYIFHGQSDTLVKEPIVNGVYSFYEAFGANILYNNVSDANHSWISPLGQNMCSTSTSPYLNNCGALDPEGEFLTHVLSQTVNPPNVGELTGSLTSFSQDYYSQKVWSLDAFDLSMDTTGYIYVPLSCQNASNTCDVVIGLHGCLQGVSEVGMDFIQQANLNQYADTNNFIVLYPQAIALTLGVVVNAEGCWDWWGYLAADSSYATKGSYQMEVIVAMVKALSN